MSPMLGLSASTGLRAPGPRAATGLAALALVAFVVVVQPSASVLRAAVMGAITLLAIVTHRRRQAIPALATSVIALMIASGRALEDYGVRRARRSLSLLADRVPRIALVRRGPDTFEPVAVDDIGIGAHVLVRLGEVLPLAEWKIKKPGA